jgi:hypothetical protein
MYNPVQSYLILYNPYTPILFEILNNSRNTNNEHKPATYVFIVIE